MAEIGIVQQVDINNQLEDAYLSYAMSVIVSRALPDVRDGLKPVHRRILYAMYDMGLHPDRPFKKSARVVGEVLGKYHPHGDVAVYEAMVRMAQDFSMRYPLVDGQGNFGSVDGDGAAAMRYTEARLTAPAMDLLADINKETVTYSFNFDGSLKQPDVLPAMLPNLLINGADGIAVGMSTKVPPHNIGEICDALDFMLTRWNRLDDVTVEDLMRFVQGPDFPTGGLIYRFRDDRGHEGADTILNAYATGRGRIVVQAKTHMEEMSRNRARLVVTELPFQTNKSNLIERIAELAREGRIEGITDLRDESDRRGMRIVIELTRTVKPTDVLAQLFKLTPLRQTFGVIMLALVDGQPRMLSLKRALQLFVEHRREVIRRRSEYDLTRARDRAHILEGLRVALSNLDEVIEIIRRSQRVDTAKLNLVKRFGLSDRQAQAILDMRLARLAALERKRIEEEYAAVLQEIAFLESLLADEGKILGVIRQELKEQKKRYNDPRRTTILTEANYTGAVIEADNLIPDSDVLITVSQKGEIQRVMNLARPPRTGRGLAHLLRAPNRQELLVLNRAGRAWRVPIHRLPEKTGRGAGELLGQVLPGWERKDEAAALLAVPTDEGVLANAFLLAVTRAGRIVRVGAGEVRNLHAGTTLINVDAKDELIWVGLSTGSDQLVLVSAQGQAIRFAEEEVRPTGIGVQGVWGMKLEEKADRIVGAGLGSEGEGLLVASVKGLVKRTPLDDFPVQGRYGKGVRAMNVDARTGPLAAAAVVQATGFVTLLTNKREGLDAEVRLIHAANRYAVGEPIPNLPTGQRLAGLMRWQLDTEKGSGIETAPNASDEAPEESASAKPARTKPTVKKADRPLAPSAGTGTPPPEPKGSGAQLSLDWGTSDGSTAAANGSKRPKPPGKRGGASG